MGRATENSRRQHVELRRLADELLALLDAAAEPGGAEIQRVLSRLAGVLKVHVAMEIEGLYPQLLEHHDEDIQALARRMIHRLKDVYDGFLTFRDAWTEDKIRDNPGTFVKQARFVAQALHESTLREERSLYERVDAAYAAASL